MSVWSVCQWSVCQWSVCALTVLCAVLLTEGSDPTCPYEICQCSSTTIYCRFKHLTSLPPLKNGSFDHTRLDLIHNNICAIQSSALSSLSHSLNRLDMQYNCMTQIPDLTHLTELQTLDLRYNQIVDPTSLQLPTSLHSLALYNNSLTRVPLDISSLINLTYLELGDNQIQTLDSVTFPSSLQTLYLYHNNIENITTIIFSHGQSNLLTLWLEYNPITHISPDAFNQIPKLSSLDLSSTKLTRLPLALHSLSHLTYLALRDIPTLVCTCQEASLVTWYTNVTFTLPTGSDCAGGSTVDYFLRHLAPNCPHAGL